MLNSYFLLFIPGADFVAKKANRKKNSKARHKKNSPSSIATTNAADVTRLLERALEYFRRDEFFRAENIYRKVLDHDPVNEDALHFIGMIYTQNEQHAELVKRYDRALIKDPKSVSIYNNRGISLVYQREFWLAIASFERALDISPDDADTHTNLGGAFNRIGEYEKSLEHYKKAVSISPLHTEAHYNLGNTYRKLKCFDEAVACFNRALAIDPQHKDAFYNLCLISRNVCDWSRYQEFEREMLRRAQTAKSMLMPFNLLSWCDDPEVQLACARNYIDDIIPLNTPRLDTVPELANGRVKIGYLSSDFRQHVVAQLIVELFELHDRDKFEVFAFSHGPEDGSELSARLVKAVDHFIAVGHLSDSDVARLIQQQEIAILVDLNGHSKGARTRILALRPAPIQINYLGYIGTMGASFIDYVVVDKTAVPAEMQPFFSEKLLQLPCYMVHDSQRVIASETMTRAEAGLPEAGFVYCCFNNSYKITPKVFDIWMRCLLAVPDSVLWLVEESEALQRNLRQEAESRGVNSARLIFAARILPAQHLARLRLADLFLDTLIYNAGATACDALWAGLPVLTCQGNSFVARMGGGLVSAAGVPELVVDTLSEYERLAVELADKRADKFGLLQSLRERLITQRGASLLFDSQRFCNELEKSYLDIWAQWLESQASMESSVHDSAIHKVMLNDAIALHQQGELDGAERGYRSLLKMNPSEANALHLLGTIQAQRGRVSEAIDLYHQAININPQLTGAYNNLGVALYGRGHYQQASESFRQAVELMPNAESCFNLGNCLYELKKYDEAILLYQQALEINPHHVQASINLKASMKVIS
ncbi:TPR domain protein, putative component of TonB system [hydrothermal vent metagenome]|uniref:protein O-GlcNAc transferase n=1 Tax=hydrothermal vent metagenome TaxID=652676 RepID=A0A3B0Z844_9ZZZZ